MGYFRLFLAELVVLNHTKWYSDFVSIDIGFIAVASFFFISGFLMPLAFREYFLKYDLKTAISKYFLNRFLRIYPLYWVSCLVILGMYFIGYLLFKDIDGRTIDPNLLLISTYFQNFILIGLNQSTLWGGYHRLNNPAWTLDVEFQFYLLVPFIIICLGRYPKLTKLMLLLASLISLLLIQAPRDLVDIDRSLFSLSIFFILGLIFFNFKSNKKITHNKDVWFLISIMIFFASFLCSNINLANMIATLAFLLFSAILLIDKITEKESVLNKFCGDLSYPVYILHFITLGTALQILHKLNLDSASSLHQFILIFLFNILLSNFFGVIAIFLVIKPIELLRNKIR